MAVVRHLGQLTLERDSRHSEADCTYTIVTDEQGEKYLQVDTYGSATRQFEGKKSQSIRFAPEAIAELKAILAANF